MKREILNEYLGKYVLITFFDGCFTRDSMEGKLCYCPEFSEKYGYKKPGYYYIENLCFKASHVKKLRVVTIET